MSMIYHPSTGFEVGDPEKNPFAGAAGPSAEDVRAAFSSFILSASGFRKVFAVPSEGQAFASWSGVHGVASAPEDSLSPDIAPADAVLVALAARAYALELTRRVHGRHGSARQPRVILGMDTRPTGPRIADIMARAFIGLGIEPRHCYISAAPEIMAFAGSAGRLPPEDPDSADGFAYISASHNPPGHNGIKFGFASGGVLSSDEVAPIIEELKRAAASENPAEAAREVVGAADPAKLAECYRSCQRWKRKAISAYTLFTHEVVTGIAGLEDQAKALDELASGCAAKPLGVVGELNGSARTLSIDADFLAGLGIRARFAGTAPRVFARRIVPEGASLELCMKLLDEARGEDPAFQLGYAPDCDGDRGNLVVFDQSAGRSRILEAQEVFSLSCVAELAGLARTGMPEKTAVVVNDGTSMRIERIASRFGASVFRAETGEANVVALARLKREDGWTVRILGEGSNGGTIVHPSKVRDPLSTIGAAARLLRLPDSPEAPSLYRLWLRVCGREGDFREDYSLADVLATLPAWASTSVFEERAALKIAASDKTALKSAYARIFLREWKQSGRELAERFGFHGWKAFASKGTREFEVGEDFAASGSGGLRIVFHDAGGSPRAFVWMRGSGTEPVFRVMADIEGGSPSDEGSLLAWHTAMVRAADAGL